MRWRVGIDEAGYGPTLGPLVVALTATGWPDGTDLMEDRWSSLSQIIQPVAVGRFRTKDSRLVVGDSKKIKVLSGGHQRLGAPWRTLFHTDLPAELSADDFISKVDCLGRDELLAEPWWRCGHPVVLVANCGASQLDNNSQMKPLFRAIILVVAVEHFNAICRQSGSKGAVTGNGWISLLSRFLGTVADGDVVEVLADKQGGRDRYGSMLLEATSGAGWVIPEREGAAESIYRCTGLPYDLRLKVTPRAEASCPNVALASMIAKHMRDTTMEVFHSFWAALVPGLQPTAGYPGDAIRYIEAIQPVAERLGIAMNRLRRER